MKQIIAVDIDEVLAANAPSFVAYTNEQWGMGLTVDDYHEHWAELWQVDHAVAMQRAKEYNTSEVIGSMGHFEEAKSVLTSLAAHYELVIVTARRRELEAVTADWVQGHYGQVFSVIHHAGIWDDEHPDASTFTKADLCTRLGVSYLIDDQSKHCNAVQAAGMQAVMFGNYPWNKNDRLVTGVVRCTDWGAVGSYFEQQRNK